MDMFFNELSVRTAAHSAVAKNWMMTLMTVYKAARERGFGKLRMPRSIAGELLAPNYTISHWLNDGTVDQVARSLFRSQAEHPFVEDIIDQKSEEGQRLFEFSYGGKMARGLGMACLYASLAVSLDSDKHWNTTSISIHATFLSDEDELTESEKIVRHSCRTEHLDSLRQWIETVTKPPIPNGKILWLKRKTFFPHLHFCASTENQVSHLHENLPEFVQIKKRLFELESYCPNWEKESFDPKRLPSKLTPESEPRLNRLKDQLTILCPDDTKRLFSWHFRYTPGAGRLYICPDEEKKMMFVGRVGPKLQ